METRRESRDNKSKYTHCSGLEVTSVTFRMIYKPYINSKKYKLKLCNMGKYIITDPEGRLEDRGTVNKPHLHHISPGCRNKASLIFHLQIALTFVQVTSSVSGVFD